VTDPEALLTLWWWTGPTGRVDLIAWLEHPETEEATVVVALQCNTRLRDIDDVSYRAGVVIEDHTGEPDACDPRQADDREAAVQIMRFTFRGADAGGRAQVRGVPVSPWSDQAAGERVSQVPWVFVGGPSRNAYVEEESLHEPVTARLSTTVKSWPSESLEAHFPTTIEPRGDVHGAVTSTADQSSFAYGPSVTWRVEWSAEEMRSRSSRGVAYYHHTSGTATWSDPAKVARAQLWLLLSGVLLGIVGSVLIEWLFSWAARRSTT